MIKRTRSDFYVDHNGPSNGTPEPTDAEPGSQAKLDIMAQRFAMGQDFFSPDDPVDLHAPIDRSNELGRQLAQSGLMQVSPDNSASLDDQRAYQQRVKYERSKQRAKKSKQPKAAPPKASWNDRYRD